MPQIGMVNAMMQNEAGFGRQKVTLKYDTVQTAGQRAILTKGYFSRDHNEERE